MIKAICFDLDATLVRSDEVILKSFEHVFKKYFNLILPLNEYKKYMGPPLYKTFGLYTNGNKELNDLCINEFISYYKTIELPLIRLCPGVKETFEYLKNNNYKIFLITTKFYSSSEPSITHLEIKDYFTDFYCLEKQKEPKPSPEPIYQIMKDYNLKKDEIIMIGDNEVDIMCGKNANVLTGLVMYNEWSNETKEKTNPDYLLNSMDELINVLKEN